MCFYLRVACGRCAINDERRIQNADEIRRRQGPRRFLLFAARAGRARHRQDLAAAGQHPHRARIGAAQLRREESPAQRCRDAGELEREDAGERGNSVRRRAHRLAGFHRRAAAGRSGRDAQRGAAAGRRSENHRAARAGRSRGRSLGAGRFLRIGRTRCS